ncbi:MAG: Beta-barrel assembly-enhancing protease [Candidatus Erwinia impunctatus]|nr:Beta-barrel assembly-enhancing protease [Culicoides impunctatus]
MRHRLNTAVATLFMSLFTFSPAAMADVSDTLPEIGTTAGSTLTISQEMLMGDFYVRQLRSSTPLINDPLLNNYINQLGKRMVAHAWSVKTPFHFFLIDNDQLNAFAFFGGNVVLHSALFRYTDNESQLASVMAHEISHVTQRHLARAMEEQRRSAPLTWAGALGSILLAMANPQAGIAALTGTLAGTQQNIISFTQQNEQEADRIGIQVLQRAGFDPEAMPDFLQKLADQSRFASKPPEILLTHPLPDSRLSDIRNRANKMKSIVVQSPLDFYLAKVRILGMYSRGQNQLTDELLNNWQRGNVREQNAATYGKAVQNLQKRNFAAAKNLLTPLLNAAPDNIWYLDLMTDIGIGLKQPEQAITRLQASKSPHPVIQLNLANALVEAGKPAEASKILWRYTWRYKDDPNGWALLAKASADQHINDEELAARAESLALTGQLDQAIRCLSSASASVALGSLKQSQYDARIDQLRQLQARFKQFEK